MISATTPPVITAGSTSNVRQQVAAIWSRRDLMVNLTRREVTVRHKNSLLGLFWNLLSPLLQLLVYTVVFTYFMPRPLPHFAIKLLSGTVLYGMFSASLRGGATSITRNTSLIMKIWFPREVLPLAAVASNVVTFASQLGILVVALALYRHPPAWGLLWLAVLAAVITLVLAVGLALILATVNVFFRDTQHLLDMVVMALFWFTPIIWNYDFLASRVIERFGPWAEPLLAINPLIPLVTAFQRVFYNPAALPVAEQAQFELMLRPTSWYLTNLAVAAIVAVAVLLVGLRVFRTHVGSFAERL